MAGAPLEVMFRHNKDGRLLQLLLMQSRTARRSVLRKVMFPPLMPALGAPAVRIRYRRPWPDASRNRFVQYARYLGRTALDTMPRPVVSLFLHGLSLWVSTRALSTTFWAFLGVCFFF